MTRRALLIFCIVVAAACSRESRAPQPPPAEAPPAPQTSSQRRPPETSSVERVRTVVRDFGAKLQLVSLLAPPDVVERSMREHYGPLVTPTLLQRWVANPASAPGRTVSSPWPDRIEIQGLKSEDSTRYAVDGEVVEITSDRRVVHKTAVRLIVEEGSGAWRIADYSTQREDAAGPEAAVAVIDAYYAAINRRDYERAYRYWSGEGSASGQSLEQFRNGFADTAAVEIRTDAPGRIDPAAGSRYIEIPIEITAKTTDGKTQRFRGNYVLRRSVVDGATEEQQQWRIASAQISRLSR
jgi:hypothetical protein